ncbi:bifunctional 4-hydroxy-2-oxoglutarate aldolase/2-dehydro-3-deoxy-phosphogluconate aldolase [Streptomyces sp. NBC_00986]|uniref:bifunctional 4-hydroxy-2-oxoglutarate aldolase/2-dehydro-3-deoxy-phosphogluconate aldolase n=1 Tax=Streptomyces sp. NBC_00986 TaxID=2903702 RepID=UPI00386BBE1F|nr:bifunctional 4-hydroxy-2-oxoglutarate aldolase/2-dehydro-3-deoxy-phosphogluconate aldolase [Streptomyces sp. NBC_00986]
MTPDFLTRLAKDRVIAVVRAPEIPDAAALREALRAGGIRWIEFTRTTPGLAGHLRRAVADGQDGVGAGTVMTAAQAEELIEAGAQYLVTPGCRPGVAEAGAAAGVPVVMGALSPTEVGMALDLGVDAVKIFPARAFGPRHFRDLAGPFPDVPLVASGGVNAENAAGFLAAGARAVCAGSEVVPPAVVAAGDWAEITRRARVFTDALSAVPSPV